MMVNFGNRYAVLANLIRHLHDEVIRDNVSPKDAKRFLVQIKRLNDRLRLIEESRRVLQFPLFLHSFETPNAQQGCLHPQY